MTEKIFCYQKKIKRKTKRQIHNKKQTKQNMSTTANVTTNANNSNQSCDSVIGVEQRMIGSQTIQQDIKCSSLNRCLKCVDPEAAVAAVATVKEKNSVKRRFPMHLVETDEVIEQMQHKSMPIPAPVTVVSKNCLLIILAIVVGCAFTFTCTFTYRLTSNLQHEVAASKILNVNLEKNLKVMSTDVQTLSDSVKGLTASVSILGLENQACANKNKNLVSQNKIEVEEHKILKQDHHELQDSYNKVEGEKSELLVKNGHIQDKNTKLRTKIETLISQKEVVVEDLKISRQETHESQKSNNVLQKKITKLTSSLSMSLNKYQTLSSEFDNGVELGALLSTKYDLLAEEGKERTGKLSAALQRINNIERKEQNTDLRNKGLAEKLESCEGDVYTVAGLGGMLGAAISFGATQLM